MPSLPMDEFDDDGWTPESEYHPLYLMHLGADMRETLQSFWERQRDADGLPEVWQ